MRRTRKTFLFLVVTLICLMALYSPIATLAANVTFSDNFANANNWALDSGKWKAEGGFFTQSDSIAGAEILAGQATLKDVKISDGTIEFKVKITSPIVAGNWAGISVRKEKNDPDHIYAGENGSGYLIFLDDDGNLQFLKEDAPALHKIHNIGFSPINKDVTIKVEMNGNNFKIYYDGNLGIEATDSTYPKAGYISLCTSGLSAKFSEFSINGVGEGPAEGQKPSGNGDKPDDKPKGDTSPKTGDGGILSVIGLAVVSGSFVLGKRKRIKG